MTKNKGGNDSGGDGLKNLGFGRGEILRNRYLLSKSFSKVGGAQFYFTNPSVREFNFGGLGDPGGPWGDELFGGRIY